MSKRVYYTSLGEIRGFVVFIKKFLLLNRNLLYLPSEDLLVVWLHLRTGQSFD